MRWTDTIHYILAQATAAGAGMEFTEVGHGDVLTKMVHKIRAAMPPPAPAAATSAANGRSVGNPEDKVRQWNLRHPVGTRVRAAVLADAVAETRTQAVLLFQHRAAVYLQGYNGYFDLDEVVPA